MISFSQLNGQDSNLKNVRRLENEKPENILIGFYNYNTDTLDNITISSFNTYILLKNWNNSKINRDNDFPTFNISSNIVYPSDNSKKVSADFVCTLNEIPFDQEDYFCPSNDKEKPSYCIINYICELNSTESPKTIDLTTEFLNNAKIKLNKTAISSVSPWARTVKNDITSLNYKMGAFKILTNATFLSKNPSSFKIKGKMTYGFSPEAFELLAMTNSNPKKISCIRSEVKEEYNNIKKEQDEIPETPQYKDFTFETEGQNNLAGADLKYAIGNTTKGNHKLFVLDFKEGSESTITGSNSSFSSKSKGLSTGAIIAILIPAIIVLLGVAGLTFFLGKPTTPQPVQNVGNNTIGVASSEAVVHQ